MYLLVRWAIFLQPTLFHELDLLFKALALRGRGDIVDHIDNNQTEDEIQRVRRERIVVRRGMIDSEGRLEVVSIGSNRNVAARLDEV